MIQCSLRTQKSIRTFKVQDIALLNIQTDRLFYSHLQFYNIKHLISKLQLFSEIRDLS